MTRLTLVSMALAAMSIFAACESTPEDRSFGTEILDMAEPGEDRGPRITFKDTLFDTGRIAQGEVVETQFEFTNTGDAPLIISSVSGSCGCTIPRSYPTQKIFPGEGGTIEVIFDSDNKWGRQTVVISVVTNTVPSRSELLIKTDIAVPDNLKNQ